MALSLFGGGRRGNVFDPFSLDIWDPFLKSPFFFLCPLILNIIFNSIIYIKILNFELINRISQYKSTNSFI
jgi:hypothetical protein